MASIARVQAALDDRSALPVLATRLLGLFALQGIVVLAAFAALGPETVSSDLPLGMQLDPRHAVLHLFVGVTALVTGFAMPTLSRMYLAVFGVTYVALAFFGTFTSIDFGMELWLPENTLHWVLGLGSVALAWWTRPTSA